MPRALLVILLATSLAAFGGTYRWSTAPVLAGAVLLALASFSTLRFPRSMRVLDLALVTVIVGLALQCLPLPVGVHDALSPHANRIAETVQLRLPGSDGRWRPLSLDPVATLHALGTFLSATLVFWAARGIFSESGVRKTCRAIALIGGAMAIVALLQRATAPRMIYGVWAPDILGATPLGPFINRNHFATWLVMAIPLVAGYFVAHVRIHLGRDPRDHEGIRTLARSGGLTTMIAIGTMVMALMVSLSRSALVGLGVAAIAAWGLARSRVDLGRGAARVVTLAAGVTLIFTMAILDPDQVAARIDSTLRTLPTDRLTIWRESLPMVRDFWAFGVGAGAYGHGMLVYQQTRVAMPHLQIGAWAQFNQAHSHYLQVLAEGGVLLTVPVLVALGVYVGRARRALAQEWSEAMWMRIGAGTGLMAVATQSIWETGLRMPANALLCATLAAIAIHHRERR